jgi:ABC-2 type transport system permease protein
MMVGYVLFLTMLGLSVVAFGVPLRGSIILLLGLAILYLLAEIGKGVLASMTSKTQLQAFLLVFVVAMVDMIFSGYAVAVETMPPVLRDISTIIPIRQWLIIMRGIMLKASGGDILYPHILLIIGVGAVIISVTARQYRRNVG